MEPEYLDAYARLFGKFVDAYRAEGVNIQMVMPQNEPNSDQNFPSCCWTAADLNTFVGQYLGPEMEKHNTAVYFGTEERHELKHLSHYVQEGAKKLELGGAYDDVLGFVNPDNSVVLVMANQTDEDAAIDIQMGEKTFNICLAANSFNTIVIK